MEGVAIAVGEAALSGAFKTIFQVLTPEVQKKWSNLWGVDKELKELERTLRSVEAYLNDAEDRQYKEGEVRRWLNDLRCLIYDMEDILDKMNTEAIVRDMKERNKASAKSVCCFPLSSLVEKVNAAIRTVSIRRAVASKINEVIERLEKTEKRGTRLNLRGCCCVERPLETARIPETSSICEEENAFGRDQDKENLIASLLSEVQGEANVSVIPVVGMGGLGKTTLAQLIYHDQRVQNHFELKIWVCVSDEFDLKRVTKFIVESASGGKFELSDLDSMQCRLKDLVSNQKFLLILDDVWTEKHSDWDRLKAPLRYGKSGSKIVVTTRSEMVSKIMGTVPMYSLGVLSDDDCWELFKQRAYDGRTVDGHQNWEEICTQVVSKCKGLPLAAKALGSLLHAIEEEKWKSILESPIWDSPQEENYILPVLQLSYHRLPANIKRCFAYFSLFPKDCRFDKEQLIRMWIAEGFIQPKGNKQLEDVASEYFDTLVSRSFLNRSFSYYIMHDLIHDLAQFVAGNLCIQMGEEARRNQLSEETRHLTLTFGDTIKLDSLREARGLRTFLAEGDKAHFICDFFKNFKYLRTLRLCDLENGNLKMEITENSIDTLKHLRYLKLKLPSLRRLPSSLCSLYNLQILDLSRCENLEEVPEDIGNLYYLRCLDLQWCRKIEKLPTSIGNLVSLRFLGLTSTNRLNYVCNSTNLESLSFRHCPTLHILPEGLGELICLTELLLDEIVLEPKIGRLVNLQVLHYYHVGTESGREISQLGNLTRLQGRLNILNLENVKSVEEARSSNLEKKHHITDLGLKWNYNLDRDGTVDEGILEALKPSYTNLKKLFIESYCGFKFAKWVGDAKFSNLRHIVLSSCSKCEILPPLGQLSQLGSLVIYRMPKVKHVGREFCGDCDTNAFPVLKTLFCHDMQSLERFCARAGDFPQLTQLQLKECPKLEELSFAPLRLEELDIVGWTKLAKFASVVGLRTLRLTRFLNSFANFTTLSELESDGMDVGESPTDGILWPLTALKVLKFSRCLGLTSLPEHLPSSLAQLTILDCPELRYLPKGLSS